MNVREYKPGFIEPAVNEDTHPLPDTIQPGNRTSSSGADTGSTGTEHAGNGGDSGTKPTDSQAGGEPTVSDVVNDRIGTGGEVQDGFVGITGGSRGGDIGGNSGIIKSNNDNRVTVETKSGEVSEFSDAVFASYTPQRLTIPGAKEHPGKLVQSAAMSAVEPPSPNYAPVLHNNLIQDGLLSIAQIEALVYAGQAHSELLPNGSRKGFFIGDGTGVGKGREISGIIMDNLMQGRNKAVWVSFNEGLINDAKRDFSGIGGAPGKIFFQGKTKAGNEITHKDGILFTTYSTLRGGEKKQANDQGQTGGKTRAQQIIDWLGKDFDGVIAFDEAHSMGNAIAIKGKRGVKKPSQQAIAGINLQRELPNARVVYVSATGATEISNLSYADRLGLWGESTPFADVNSFIQDVAHGGIAAMELISRDMKAMGMYLARSLSYDGVTYERLEHTLSDLQEDIYNELAGAWQVVLNNVNQALEITQAGSSGSAKSAAMAQFWGAHQRFFNQIITAMQTPCVIDDIRRQIEAGNVAVIQLVNTNEAAQERIIADATAKDAALEDLDFTPRQMLMDYVRNGFPVAAFEKSKDDNGNTLYVPVKDSEGKQVFDREAIALRDALLETLQQIRVPENPLDSIINAFGAEMVAEVTGRSRRFVQTRDDEGNLKVVEEKRGKHSSRADAEAFQNDKRKILVFSGAGGTGYSFHADNTAVNKRKRIHYILQPGWRADAAVQGFGRSHRTNQAVEPHYVLPTTNLKAQKRFVSSIARRLDQLGALTRGQRQATSQGMFTAADNLESQYAKVGLYNFFVDLYRGKTALNFQDVTQQMGLNLLDENAAFSESKIPEIPQFLNRLLSLKTDQQNAVFGEFENRLVEAVEYAKQCGIFDEGLQTLKALSIKKTRDDVAYEDKKTGAQTRYIELDVTNAIDYYAWKDIKKIASGRRNPGDLSGWFVSEFGKNKGDVFFLADIGERLDSEGKTVRRGVVHTIKKNGHKYIDNADVIHRGWEYRTVSVNSVHSYQKVTLTSAIDESEAEKLWKAQVEAAPKTETKTERMLVGVILPIWDRVEGSEIINRLQTDDGEQLLGRMLGSKSAKQTLKNLGLDSGLSEMSASDLFRSIKNGSKAILSNGWEIAIAKVNHEDRIEIKGRGYLTDAEKRVLRDQGAFIERINWADRVFMPTAENGIEVFERITASKPVVELIEKNTNKAVNEGEQAYGIPEVNESEHATRTFNGDATIDHAIIDRHPNSINYQKDISMEKKPFHEAVAEKLIEQLKQGTAPWQRPWEPGEPGQFVPTNPITGNRYKGINAIHLIAQGLTDQRWMTYKQAEGIGAQVRKGEKGTPIQYWKFSEEQIKTDDNGKPVIDSDGKPIKEVVRLERPRVFFATVFNAEQIDGLPPLQRKAQTWDALERAEYILQASGADIRHGSENAFYRPGTDSVHLPDKRQFPQAANYYATALHELGHWTGHASRLDRDLSHPFGSEGYAKEELRAEIASMILGDELGIGHDPGQHAAYVGSWIKALQDDPLEVFRAAADAEKIQGYVLGLEQKQVQEQSTQHSQADMQEADMQLPPQDLSIAEFERKQPKPAVLTEQLAHLLTRDVFAKVATAVPLENHGRRWEVLVGDQSLGFSDANTAADAVNEVHKREVNNALYSLSTENTGIIPVQNMPSELVLSEYPDLQEQYADTVNFKQQESQASKGLPEKTFIKVPFKHKHEAKAAGAKWDRQERAWYVPAGVDFAPFAQWAQEAAPVSAGAPKAAEASQSQVQTEGQQPAQERQYLAVPFGEHVAAKAAGAVWDKSAKSWYAGPKADRMKLERWKPDNVPGQQGPAMEPEDEFAEALRSLGCVVDGKHPIMDGAKHRISVEGDKKGQQAGFYVGYLDGHPAGYIKNNKTGIDMKWKSKGYALDPAQKARLQAEAAAKLQAREAEQARLQEQTAQRVSRQMADLMPVEQQTPYMQAKGIKPQAGVLTDKDGQKTFIPATDADGKQWTMQYIQEDGTKRFAKDSRKEGCFHVVGGMEALAQAPALVIGEGYATASSLSQTLGFATVAAFDSGNLPYVAKALHEKFPDKPIIIAGDNDQHLEATQGVNPGKTKARAAANAVGGKVLLPIFAPGEQAADPKGFTDFNDLANKSVLGKDGIERQVRCIVDAVIDQHQVQAEQQQERVQKQGQGARRRAATG